MKGLNVDVAGSNAWVHLGMVERPMNDPQFWAIIQTLRCIRECGTPCQILPRLVSLAQGTPSLPDNCVSATAITRIQTLGWHVSRDGTLFDAYGPLPLFEVSINELMLRAQLAWQQVVHAKVVHRPGFCALIYVDTADTRVWLRSLPMDDSLLFQKCFNGCHITQDGKAHCQEGGSSQCPFCDCVDSRYHRFWECEQFSHLRTHFSCQERQLVLAAVYMSGLVDSAEWYCDS